MQRGDVNEALKKPNATNGGEAATTTASLSLAAQLQALAAQSVITTPLGQNVRGSPAIAFSLAASQSIATSGVRPTVTALPTATLIQGVSPLRTINVLQKQFSGQGVVGVSAVPTIAVVTSAPVSRTLTTVTTVSATGGTIHHHGNSPARGTPTTSNLSPNLTNMNVNQTAPLAQRRASGQGRVVARNVSPGQPPKKKVKLEERPPENADIAAKRKVVLDAKYTERVELKQTYGEHLTELFFLQHGMNMMDYIAWKKRPTALLVTFLKANALDSDEEEELLQEKRINDEVKVLISAGSDVPLATPVAISTTLPPSVSALQAVSSSVSSITEPASVSLTLSVPHATSSTSQLQMQLAKTLPDKQSVIQTTQAIKTPITSAGQTITGNVKFLKSPSSPRLNTRQQSISAVYDSTIGSQEAIVERAKQEAQVVQRVSELRKEGMWSARRLPKVQELPRNKAHWDYLLEEMTWLAADFIQERKWKKAGARKIARLVLKYHQDLEQKEIRAEKEEAQKLKRIAGQLAKCVKEFWSNIEKVVQYKQQSRMEEKRRKALDVHLNFIVDQTEKYSTWLTEGLHNANSAAGSSVPNSSEHSSDVGDDEFHPHGSASDDEETIDMEEKEAGDDKDSQISELEALQKEGELPIEELIKSLPQEVLEKSAEADDGPKQTTSEQKSQKEKDDKDFCASEDEGEEDLEETIAEQEKLEKKNYKQELKDLEDEGEMSMEELVKKYAGAYDSDFDLPQESSDDDDSSSEDDSDDEIDVQSDEDETTEDEESDEEETVTGDDAGLEELFKPQSEAVTAAATTTTPVNTTPAKTKDETGPGKEMTDIAAQAQSLQPKGYTLETAEVRTPVPFLLKHTLREYQHVGLDWLATMYEKKLNGILADEMGLGKTIQTIALLAHLACEKGVWGPHLIVVPTSVMLNWEMELKKWCPAFKILTYYGSQKERKLKRTGWTKTNAFHVCITSYKLVVQDHSAFRRKKWRYFILDEAQNIKNFKSQRWQMLLNFSSQRRLLLTGTPLQNSLMELWSLMHFLMPHVFQSHKEFKEWFANPLTGMVEGSQEYNDNLVRRLHKVLRPFLLRRLKDDVEKQMPKKYEHVLMCRLSKRQRFLYDEFMSQTKTRETLSQGHFMSVINVLMQLRKVCNHPNLFDPRPIVSPFHMEGLSYTTASIVTKALEYDPFKDIDLCSLYPSLAEMEVDLPAFIAHRVKNLQTSRQLIVEVDDQPEPLPRLKPGKLKPLTFRSISPAASLQPGRTSPLVAAARSASPVQLIRSVPKASMMSNLVVPTPVSSGDAPLKLSVVSQSPTLSVTGTPIVGQSLIMTQALSATQTATAASTIRNTAVAAMTQASVPAKIVQPQIQGVFHPNSSSVIPSQPITVQIQQTDQGMRLMIPTGQLSQLPAGLIQIVQTSSGQQLIATTNPAIVASTGQHVIPVQNVSSSLNINASATLAPIVNPATSLTLVTSSQLITSATKSVSAVQLPTGGLPSVQKPIMRVTPMAIGSTGSPLTIRAVAPMVMATSQMPVTKVVPSTGVKPQVSGPPVTVVGRAVHTIGQVKSATIGECRERRLRAERAEEKTELFMSSVRERRRRHRLQKLRYIANTNHKHCEFKPVYGQDLCEAVDVMSSRTRTHPLDNVWHGLGYVHCLCAHKCKNDCSPDDLWNRSDRFKELIHTPMDYLAQMKDLLSRYTFVIPSVVSPSIQMNVSHPSPSMAHAEKSLAFKLRAELSPKTACLHSLYTKMMVQFPELRLIEYDCGKLQALSVLLHRLKSGQHRALIFTQMTKMLDILEAFLSYYGHRYLRLDGTTKVEQRQFLMDRFNMDRRIFCFILSTRSGGIGVNLTGADTVIFYDSDWNPTMDAQAQDRCHRIGQTRDVHIYRLISEKTIEENILKKANQKRLLGDLAIEGGNFTTAFFKEQTISELFAEPSGLTELAKEKQELAALKAEKGREITKEIAPKKSEGETNVLAQFEQALSKAEDENDVIAVKMVKAEQKAELAEFDETIPWDEREAENKKDEDVSKVEKELAQLDKELTPIERYAVGIMELEMEEEVAEELQLAEEDIEQSKNQWELARLKALKEDEERRLELEEDEMLYTYSRDDAYNQVYVSDQGPESMPLWAPPTPPKDDNDVYIDQTMYFLYEPNIMSETQLPPVYVRKEHKKPRIETVTTRKQKQRKEEQPRVPRSLFDRPTAALLKMRREAKLQKLKQGLIKPTYRPTTQALPSKQTIDTSPDHPDWLIHEDWALLQAVQTLLSLPLNLMVVAPAHIPNWDLVSDVVNSCSRVYRSPKQCRNRYENVIIPREEGRILYDISPRKQKKTKGIYKTKNNRPMRTSQLFIQDGNNSVTMLYSLRFDSVKSIAGKRPPTMRQTLVNPTMKNPKHVAVLNDNSIIYDTPLTPLQVAANRADRIAREKKQNQAAAQAAAAAAAAEQQLAAAQRSQQAAQAVVASIAPTVQGTSTTTTPVVAASIQASHLQPLVSIASSVLPSGAVQKMAVGQGLTAVSIARTLGAGNIVVNTASGISNTFAAINKRMSQQAGNTVAVTGNLAQAVRARTPLAVHEITTVSTPAVIGTPATTAAIRTATASVNLTQAQRIAALAGTTVTGKATTVQQQLLAQSTLKSFAPQQINILRQPQSIVRPQNPQQQTIRTQKLNISKQSYYKSKLTDEQVAAIRRQQSLKHTQVQASGATQGPLQLQVTQPQVRQIIQAQVQQVGAQLSGSQTSVATLVKSVTAAGTVPSVTIPVSINVSVAQHKTAQRATVSQLQQQQQQQKMFLTQQRKTAGQKVTALTQAQVGKQQIPLIIPPQKVPLTGHLLHHIVKQQQQQQQQQGQAATIQQIITHSSQPTIIATVTQGQPTQPMVTKVTLATTTPQSHLQTLSGATPITVTQVSSTGQTHTPITLNVGLPVSQGATVVKATALTSDHPTVHVHTALGQQPKIATITQSLVSQQLQHVAPQIHRIQATQLQTTVGGSPATAIQVESPSITPQASPQAQVAAQSTTVVTQAQQQQQQQQGGQAKPYAMRTRTRN